MLKTNCGFSTHLKLVVHWCIKHAWARIKRSGSARGNVPSIIQHQQPTGPRAPTHQHHNTSDQTQGARHARTKDSSPAVISARCVLELKNSRGEDTERIEKERKHMKILRGCRELSGERKHANRYKMGISKRSQLGYRETRGGNADLETSTAAASLMNV